MSGDKEKRGTPIYISEFIFMSFTILITLLINDKVHNGGISTDKFAYLDSIGLGDFNFALSFKRWPMDFSMHRTEFPINYTIRGDPAVVFNPDEVISYEGYVQYLKDKAYVNVTENPDLDSLQFDRSVVRETMYQYIFPKLFMYNRRGPWDKHFLASWHHYSMIIIQKTLKDMIIQLDMNTFTLAEIKLHFFDLENQHFYDVKHPQARCQTAVTNYINALVVTQFAYIFKIQTEQDISYIKAPISEYVHDFCMVNWLHCEIQEKSFYLYKMLFEDDRRYLHENLLDYSDFTNFIPLVQL